MLFAEPEIFIKGFIETSFIDWRAGLSSVIFTGGCNFRCPYCHNGPIVMDPDAWSTIPFDYVVKRLEKNKKWVERVVMCGGEPTIHDDLPHALRIFKEMGLLIKLDTNGSHPDLLKTLIDEKLIDYVAMDVKGPLNCYAKWCGVCGSSEAVAESIKILQTEDFPCEFRMTVVPTLHTEEDVYDVARYLGVSAKIMVQDFRPEATILDPAFLEVTPLSPILMSTIRQNVMGITSPAS